MTDPPPPDPAVAPPIARRAAGVLLALGLLAIAVRLGLRFPLWADEAYLVLSLVRRDLATLLDPLELHQVAPPVFLLAQHGLTRVLGLDELVLRLPSAACAVVALLVFRDLARRALGGWAGTLAVGFLACSYWVMRYAAETKPYSVDLLLGVLFPWLVWRWHAAEGRARLGWLAVLVGLALVGFSVSFPSVFVGGGAVLTMAFLAWRARRPAGVGAAALVGATLVVGFAVVYAWQVSRQVSAEVEWMTMYWERAFPPRDGGPLAVAWWLLGHLAGEMSAHPAGGRHAGSAATFVLMAIGAVVLLRRRRGELLVLAVAPVALGLVATLLGRYPFGAPTRCQMHLAPMVCLLAGAGLGAALERGDPGRRDRRMLVAAAVLAAVPVIAVGRDLAVPWKSRTDVLYRDLARATWPRTPAEDAPDTVLSLREDLGATFTPYDDQHQSNVALWISNLHLRRAEIGWTAPARPLAELDRIDVVSVHPWSRCDERLRREWIEAFCAETGHVLVESERTDIPDLDKHGKVRHVDELERMRFRRPSD